MKKLPLVSEVMNFPQYDMPVYIGWVLDLELERCSDPESLVIIIDTCVNVSKWRIGR